MNKIRREDNAPITMELIQAKCIDDGGCFIWQYGSAHGTPHMSVNKKPMNVRRWIAQNVLNIKIEGKFVTSTCMDKMCCNPEHIIVVTRKKLQQMWHEELQYSKTITRRAKLQKAARERLGYDPELIDRVRNDPRPHRVIARELGRSFDFVNKIKTGRSHIQYGVNPFAGLMP